MFLGDDDCLGPRADHVAQWAKSKGIEAVSSTLPASYGWPDFYSRYYGSGYAGILAVRPYSGQSTPVDGRATLVHALRNLGGGVMGMPRAYLGMISRTLAERIRLKYGQLFGGVSPDIYSAALIAAESKTTVTLDYPFIIPGSSAASTSGQGAAGTHLGKLRENQHLGAFSNLEWDSLIPEFYSVPTVWGYSLKKAFDVLQGGMPSPNFARLYVKCLLFHPAFNRETRAAMRAYLNQRSYLEFTRELTRAAVMELATQGKRVARRIRHPRATADAISYAGLQSVGEAYVRLAEHVQNAGPSLDEALLEYDRTLVSGFASNDDL